MIYKTTEFKFTDSLMTKHVYVFTWCNQIESLYGTTLVFKTLRVGFPTAEIHVVDNASLPAVRPLLRQHAHDCDADFTQLKQGITHHKFIEQTLDRQLEGSAIFVDPDVCFWENVEAWNFNTLMAGRRLPKYVCEFSGCITHPRLHTSFLWIPDVRVLQETVWTLRTQYFELHPFRPIMFKADNVWQRFDTGGSLYAALPEQMYAFTERELEGYDHLFCGTHLNIVAPKLRPDFAIVFEQLHRQVQIDHQALKGAWRMQDNYFNSRAVLGEVSELNSLF